METSRMKTFFLTVILVFLTASCSNRTTQAIYDTVTEIKRQDCLKDGHSDCPRRESYDEYNNKREEVIK